MLPGRRISIHPDPPHTWFDRQPEPGQRPNGWGNQAASSPRQQLLRWGSPLPPLPLTLQIHLSHKCAHLTNNESVVEFILYIDRRRRRLPSRAPLSWRQRLRIICTSVVALCRPTEADSWIPAKASRTRPLLRESRDCSKIKNWRPISLLNCIYKIISKAVNNRLKLIVDTITSRAQKG